MSDPSDPIDFTRSGLPIPAKKPKPERITAIGVGPDPDPVHPDAAGIDGLQKVMMLLVQLSPDDRDRIIRTAAVFFEIDLSDLAPRGDS